MAKRDVEIVYICSHKKGEKDYWVLPHPNGMNVARIMTHLLEDVFRGTEWSCVAVDSLDSLDGVVRWCFANKTDYYAFFEGNEDVSKEGNE